MAEAFGTRTLCQGFIQGVDQFYIDLRRAEEIEAIACADPVLRMNEIRQAIVVWVDTHPDYPAERAAATTWPCD